MTTYVKELKSIPKTDVKYVLSSVLNENHGDENKYMCPVPAENNGVVKTLMGDPGAKNNVWVFKQVEDQNGIYNILHQESGCYLAQNDSQVIISEETPPHQWTLSIVDGEENVIEIHNASNEEEYVISTNDDDVDVSSIEDPANENKERKWRYAMATTNV